MIEAETHSDDRAVEVDFDATLWFEQAGDDEILALANCGWGADYPADNVALFFEGANGDVTEMFQHIGHMQNTRNPIGFECHVNEESALAWLRENRPQLATTIEANALYEETGDERLRTVM